MGIRTFIFCLLLFSVNYTYGKTIKVCASCEYTKVGTAIEAAQAGDEILLQAGVYQESGLEVDKKLYIRGENMPVIDANFEGEILLVTSDSVRIEGIEFRNVGRSHLKDLAAIRIKEKQHFVIQYNRIVNAFFGIYIEHGKNGRIEHNTLIGPGDEEMSSGNAIHCWYAEGLEIHYNKVMKHRDGIYLEFVDKSTVSNNWSEENSRYGLHFMFSNEDVYTCNTFKNNGAGVAVMFSKKIEMLHNSFEYNWGQAAYGLLLKEIYDATIQDNQFIKNTIGILLEGSTRLEYSHNEFRNNGCAIQVSGGCLDNHFYQNNFIANTLDLIIKSRVNNNTFDGNYWSEYTGYDLDRNGVGDVPHRPVKLFSFVLEQAPESIILLRSFFIDLLNYSEKVSPIFTPANVLDQEPLILPLS